MIRFNVTTIVIRFNVATHNQDYFGHILVFSTILTRFSATKHQPNLFLDVCQFFFNHFDPLQHPKTSTESLLNPLPIFQPFFFLTRVSVTALSPNIDQVSFRHLLVFSTILTRFSIRLHQPSIF